MRRMLACLLILLVLCVCQPSALADPPDQALASLCLISQKAPRYQNKRYNFNGAPLSERGCDPCAVTNMVIAAYGVTDQATSDQVLLEMLHLLTGDLEPATHKMNIANLVRLQEPDQAQYPTLAALSAQHDGDLTYTDKLVTPEAFQALLAPAMAAGKGMIAIGKVHIRENWADMLSLCRWLDAAGYGDAYYIITHVTGGTADSNSPFRSTDGHYITLLIQPETYLADGSFYLLDSLPRALADEPNRNQTYWRRYPFTLGTGNFQVFRETYTPTRLLPTLLRFSLSEAELAELASLEPDARDERRLRNLNILKIYGEAAVAVCLPARITNNGD